MALCNEHLFEGLWRYVMRIYLSVLKLWLLFCLNVRNGPFVASKCIIIVEMLFVASKFEL